MNKIIKYILLIISIIMLMGCGESGSATVPSNQPSTEITDEEVVSADDDNLGTTPTVQIMEDIDPDDFIPPTL